VNTEYQIIVSVAIKVDGLLLSDVILLSLLCYLRVHLYSDPSLISIGQLYEPAINTKFSEMSCD
jgi:hypothetical protein